MGPISTPSILAFLHYLTVHHSNIEFVSSLPRQGLEELLSEFEASRGNDYSNTRGLWRLFLSDPISGGLPLRKKTVFSILRFRLESKFKSIATDPLERYRRIPNKAIFFYTSEDYGLIEYLERHWDAIHETCGDILDIYDYSIRVSSSRYQSFAKEYIRSLQNIPGLSIGRIMDAGLPCLFIWSQDSSVAVPLADAVSDQAALRDRIRQLIKFLSHSGALTEWQIDEIETIEFDDSIIKGHPQSSLKPVPCDVFISYTRSERDLVESFSALLTNRGIDPWFDRDIPCGERFRSRIKVQMEYAAASLICLTERAKKSPWVLAEALYAAKLGTAFPILIGDDKPFRPISSLHHLQLPADIGLGNNAQAEYLLGAVEKRVRSHRAQGKRAEIQGGHAAAVIEARSILMNGPTSGQAARQIRRLKKWKECYPNVDHAAADVLINRFTDII